LLKKVHDLYLKKTFLMFWGYFVFEFLIIFFYDYIK
jgi:hypothetical protein